MWQVVVISWAVLADIATGEAGHKLMDRVEEELKCAYGYVQCAPSYTKGDITIGSDSVLGGNVWVTESLPPGTKVVAPAENLIRYRKEESSSK